MLLFINILSLICTINFSLTIELKLLYFIISLIIFLVSSFLIYYCYINKSKTSECGEKCGNEGCDFMFGMFKCGPDCNSDSTGSCDCTPDCSC